jgi:hypothetical protein
MGGPNEYSSDLMLQCPSYLFIRIDFVGFFSGFCGCVHFGKQVANCRHALGTPYLSITYRCISEANANLR